MSHSPIIPQKPLDICQSLGQKLVSGCGGEFKVVSPYNNQVIGEGNESTLDNLNEAIDLASKAQKKWVLLTLRERAQVFRQWRECLIKKSGQMVQIICAESGKVPFEAQAEINKAIEDLDYAISLYNFPLTMQTEVSKGIFCSSRQEALGVVGVITPFNFPIMVPMWSLPLALMAGNAVVWKPSEKTPLASLYLMETFNQCDFPKGLMVTVHGGRLISEHILQHPQVKAISFVGSTPVAKQVYQMGTHSGKRVLALGGAKNHILLMPDASKEMAIQGIVDSFTGCAGQRCMAASVLLCVGESEALLKEIALRAKQKVLAKDMGAIITKESKERHLAAIKQGEKEGNLLLDGRVFDISSDFQEGHWLAPSIISELTALSTLTKEELFGPILSVVKVKNLEEALSIEEMSSFGNACSVFTNSGMVAQEVSLKTSVGMVGVNIGVPVPRSPFSFGGTCDSRFGYGDITGLEGFNFWSQLKKTTQKWSMPDEVTWLS